MFLILNLQIVVALRCPVTVEERISITGLNFDDDCVEKGIYVSDVYVFSLTSNWNCVDPTCL